MVDDPGIHPFQGGAGDARHVPLKPLGSLDELPPQWLGYCGLGIGALLSQISPGHGRGASRHVVVVLVGFAAPVGDDSASLGVIVAIGHLGETDVQCGAGVAGGRQ